MKTFIVRLTRETTESVDVTVTAKNEEQAKNMALDRHYEEELKYGPDINGEASEPHVSNCEEE